MPSTILSIMPGRYIREGVLASERVHKLTEKVKPNAENFYLRLLLIVDDYGRFEAIPKLLNSRCFPMHESIDNKDIVEFLKQCSGAKLLDMYAVNSKWYLQIHDFRQRTRGPSR